MRKWQYKLHSIIYEADTPAGKLFDVLLLITILLSVLFVALESVDYIDDEYHIFLDSAEISENSLSFNEKFVESILSDLIFFK